MLKKWQTDFNILKTLYKWLSSKDCYKVIKTIIRMFKISSIFIWKLVHE